MPTQITPTPDMNLLTYRLKEIENSLEKNIEKLSDKIDLLLAELNKTTVAQSETKVKVEKLEAEVASLIKADNDIKNQLTQVRVSVAEKLTWGAAGGGLINLIISYFQTGGQ